MFEILFGPAPIVAIQEFFGRDLAPLFRGLTLLGTSVAILPIVTLLFWLRGRTAAYAVILAIALSSAVDFVLWQTVGLHRPSAPQIIKFVHVPVSSFPSGHVVSATILYGMLVMFGSIPLAAAATVVLLVGLSRLYLGAHFLGDVLGGVLVGLLVLVVFRLLWPKVSTWLAERSFQFYLILAGVALLAAFAAIPFVPSHSEVWRAWGTIVGGIIAALLEYTYVRYTPHALGEETRRKVTLIGLTGIVLFLALAFGPIHGNAESYQMAAFMALGALWGILLAPAIFIGLGLGRSRV